MFHLVIQWAKKTGDYSVLSHPDLCVLALTHLLHEEGKKAKEKEKEKESAEASSLILRKLSSPILTGHASRMSRKTILINTRHSPKSSRSRSRI